jgi:hypothetical protein
MRRAYLFLVVLALLIVAFPSSVAAQEADFSSQTISEVTPVASTSAQPNVQEELNTLTQQYFDEVEQYRDVERRYLIARETYYQNNTLAAQDDALRVGQELLRARAKVLETYFTYLQKDLDRTLGVVLNDKVLMLNELERVRSELTESQKNAGTIANRTQLNTTFALLNSQQTDLESIAYETLSLIKIGQIQNAIDQATFTQNMVGQWLAQAQLSAASKAKKERGLQEVEPLIQAAKNNLLEVNERWRNQSAQGRYSQGTYNGFQERAEFSYLQLRQAHTFLDEIVRTP